MATPSAAWRAPRSLISSRSFVGRAERHDRQISSSASSTWSANAPKPKSPPRTARQGRFYIPSLSARTIVYKGLLLAPQIAKFYRELSDPEVMSALCLVHQRFSTNTFPTWQLAHPYRYVAHNGEINTVRGNVNWMHARQIVLASPLFGDDIKKLFPIIQPGGSDSASLR